MSVYLRACVCMCVCVWVCLVKRPGICVSSLSPHHWLQRVAARNMYIVSCWPIIASVCVCVCVCFMQITSHTKIHAKLSLSIAVTVSPNNVIAIRGVDGHDFTKFCFVTDIRSDLQTNNIRLSECI